ncbi:MAG: DNA modification methylase, partial [Cyclobacteriaceae bacterium]
MSQQQIEIIEYTDPLCSIAWGTEPFKRKLQWRFGETLRWRPEMAGLCKDNSTVKMFQPWDPIEARQLFLICVESFCGLIEAVNINFRANSIGCMDRQKGHAKINNFNILTRKYAANSAAAGTANFISHCLPWHLVVI